MQLPLIALFIAAFAFGTTEFVIAGVLPQVADGLDVTVPTAGYLVSGYALGIALGGPLLTIATARVSRKTLLIALAIAFTAGQAACALAPDFASMLFLRFATALAHGVFFGVAMVVATSLVPEEQRGRAVALVLAGLTVSNIIGVPAGTAIGNAFGWRSTFWAMFILGLLALAAMIALLPRRTGAARPAGIRSEVRVLGRQQVWSSLIMMLMLMIGQFVPFTYITPMLMEVTGLAEAFVPWVLLAVGVGSTIGVFAGGRLADWNLMPTLIVLTLVQAAVLVTVYFVSPLPGADDRRPDPVGRAELRHRHCDPDPHPRLDRRRPQPGVVTHSGRLQRRHRGRSLHRRHAAQWRLRLSQPARAGRLRHDPGGRRSAGVQYSGAAQRPDAAGTCRRRVALRQVAFLVGSAFPNWISGQQPRRPWRYAPKETGHRP